MRLPPNATAKQAAEFTQKQLFVRDAMPSEWLDYAEELAAAAEALWANSDNRMEIRFESEVEGPGTIQKEIGHCRSYILLAGLALENVLKAALIAQDPTLINTGTLAGSLKSHQLTDLASRSGLAFGKAEQRLMRVCQDAIPYWGRYPIPLTYARLKPKQAANARFRDQFRRLHFRLCKLVYDRIKEGWDSGVGPKCVMLGCREYDDEPDLEKRYAWIELPTTQNTQARTSSSAMRKGRKSKKTTSNSRGPSGRRKPTSN